MIVLVITAVMGHHCLCSALQHFFVIASLPSMHVFNDDNNK